MSIEETKQAAEIMGYYVVVDDCMTERRRRYTRYKIINKAHGRIVAIAHTGPELMRMINLIGALFPNLREP